MPKIQNITLVNTKKFFDKELSNTCKKNKIPLVKVHTRNILIDVSTNKVRLFHKNSPLHIDSSYVHFSRDPKDAGINDRHVTSLIAEYCKKKSIPFTDPINIYHQKSAQKISQFMRFALDGIPIPRSYILDPDGYSSNKTFIEKHVKFPCVVKVGGINKGKGVFQVKSKTALEKLIRSQKGQTLIKIQEFIHNSFDIRVLLFRGHIIGSIKRSSIDGFYNNVALGGEVEEITLTPDEKKLAKKTAKSANIDFVGVDIIRTRKGPIILEANKYPVFDGFEKATGLNVSRIVAEEIFKRYGLD